MKSFFLNLALLFSALYQGIMEETRDLVDGLPKPPNLEELRNQLQDYVNEKLVSFIHINRVNSSLFPISLADENQVQNYGRNGIPLSSLLADKRSGVYEIKMSVFRDATVKQFDVVDFIGTPYEGTKVGHLDTVLVEKTFEGVSILALYDDQQDVISSADGFGKLCDALLADERLGEVTKSKIKAIAFN